MLWCWWSYNLYINVKRICIWTSKHYHFSTLKQRQNLTLKQRWFWVDTKTNFVFTNRLNMSNQLQQVNIDKFPRHFDVLCSCNCDERMVEVILMYFFDIISTDGKLTQLQRAFWKKKYHGRFSAPDR